MLMYNHPHKVNIYANHIDIVYGENITTSLIYIK